MKKRYVVILVILGILIIAGISFAYFTATSKINADTTGVTVQTATIENVGLVVEGTLTFNDEGILPGHKNVSAIKVTATAENQIIEYNLIWQGKNTLQTGLKYYVYRSKTPIDPTPEIDCTKTQSGNANYRKHFEVCKENNFEDLGEVVATGNIDVGDEVKATLLTNEVIKGTKDGNPIYYYVVLEFVNQNSDQNIDINGEFDGIVTVEEAENSLADITIRKIYLINEEGEKSETTSVPKEGYTLDKDQSSCEGGATLDWNNGTNSLMVHATQSGTKCDISFKAYNPYEARDKILAGIDKDSITEGTFTGTSCSDGCSLKENGIYKTQDDFGDSYVYRGTVDNNWVVFGQEKNSNKYIWWRIIRINGNGTIRLIYAGTSSDKKTAPNPQGVDTMITPKQTISSSYPRAVYFNQTANDNTYVGYRTGGTGKNNFNETHTNASNSTVLDEIVNWYTNNTNLGTLAADYIDVDTGFCGDRQVDKTVLTSYQGEGYGTSQTGYAPWGRLYNNNWKKTQTPTLKCGYKSDGSTDKTAQERDLYTGPSANVNGTKGSNGTIVKGNNKLPVPVGLITSDEVVFAGGFGGQTNNGYWLYTNQYYWTMSPNHYDGSGASVFIVHTNGNLSNYNVSYNAYGVRPVINLDGGLKLSGSGGATDPYTVEGVE